MNRLRALCRVLETDESIEVDSPEWPGLAATATVLTGYAEHRDKEVRLHSVQACMELFAIVSGEWCWCWHRPLLQILASIVYQSCGTTTTHCSHVANINNNNNNNKSSTFSPRMHLSFTHPPTHPHTLQYAPEAPWDETEILAIFQQTIRQLANLATTTTAQGSNFTTYRRILQLLAEVQIGVVLVELAKNYDPNDPDCRAAEHPLELLVDLVRTLLHAVRNEHSPEILSLAAKTIGACLDEYNHGMPVKILDEILLVIGQGPTTLVTNPAVGVAQPANSNSSSKRNNNSNNNNSKKEKMPPLQVSQSNPSYVLAATVIRKTLNKMATPVAALLNGLLNNEAHIYQQSTITVDLEDFDDASNSKNATTAAANNTGTVWNIVYELHAVAPQILTTVIGTVSNGLRSPDAAHRLAVTQLLGRLFGKAKSDMAAQFQPCFREWLARQTDVEAAVRRVVVESCVRLLDNHHCSSSSNAASTDVTAQVDACLIRLVTSDPVTDVRLEAIHLICDLSYRRGCVTAKLLQAVGSRVSAKHKQERRDALTGLGQIYYRHFCQDKLRAVQAAGDDCDTAVILQVLHDTCHLETRRRRGKQGKQQRRGRKSNGMDFDHADADAEDRDDAQEEKYGWIPHKVFESAYFSDQADADMRSRVIQIMDDILLGSDLSSSSSSKKMTATARAVGLAMIVDSLREGENLLTEEGTSNGFRFLKQLLKQRATLQKTLSSYIDARAKIRECQTGTLR